MIIMKIALVVPYFSGFGSNESEIAEEFMRKGHKVTVFTTNVRSGSRLKNISYSLNKNFDIRYVKVLYNFMGWPYTIDFSEELKDFDLILGEEDYQYMSYIAYLAAKKYNIKIIVSNERYYVPKFPKSIFLKTIEAIYTSKLRNHVPFITVHANSAKKYLRSIGFKKNIPVIFTAINLSRFKIKKSNIIQDKYNLSRKDIVVFTIGRLVEFKNYLKLIEEFSKLPKNYKLIIVGKGELEQKFRKYITNNNINNIILETTFLKPNIIQQYMNSSDIYIQPSIIEPFGIAVREAMVLGKPIIVTKEGGMIETINGNGSFISKNLNNLKEKIDDCYKNKKKYSRKSIELAKMYDVSKICNQYLKLIKN